MKIVQSPTATKYTHANGTETSIKRALSGKYTSKDLDNPEQVDNNKYSVIISCSAGCRMKCSFCHLTDSGKVFKKLDVKEVLANIQDAITEEIRRYPGLAQRNIKLCWMGEGEPFQNLDLINEVTCKLLAWAINSGMAAGIDGVDISTCLPKMSVPEFLETKVQLQNLKSKLYNNFSYARNTGSVFRIFYSLHSVSEDIRGKLVPGTYKIQEALDILNALNPGVDMIAHYMFINEVNDSMEEVAKLCQWWAIEKSKYRFDEFRVLRYNPKDNTTQESRQLKSILEILEPLMGEKLKVQFSAGEEIKSACGMFGGK